MIVGIGIDIIEIARIEDSIERLGTDFLQKVYTAGEIIYCESKIRKYQHYAARFAAKEAIYKAFTNAHQKGLTWQDIEIHSDESGMPLVKFINKVDEFRDFTIQISLSHSENYAVCSAIVLKQ